MKRFLYIAVLSIAYLSACSGPSGDDHRHEEGAHTHEDGSTHADHEDHAQEEFTVGDSTRHDQLHEAGEEHDH